MYLKLKNFKFYQSGGESSNKRKLFLANSNFLAILIILKIVFLMYLPCFQAKNIFLNEFSADKNNLGVRFFTPIFLHFYPFKQDDLKRNNAKIFVQQCNFLTSFPNKTRDLR